MGLDELGSLLLVGATFASDTSDSN